MSTRAPEPVCVVSFSSTHDAVRAELACTQAGVPGRIIPTPVQIHADCGLAWKMPPAARARSRRPSPVPSSRRGITT